MSETYVDAGRYQLQEIELVLRRSFWRPHNVVILPRGWMPSASSIPAVKSAEPDGRVRLDFTNPRPDEIDTLITAQKAN